MEKLPYYVLLIIAASISIVLHEVAHGYAAYLLGDDTAKRYGRLSLNPLRHIDSFGTIGLPMILLWIGSPFMFGWAKPVPVNFARLRHPRRDMVIVSAAGIMVNLALFGIGYLLFLSGYRAQWFVLFSVQFMMINFALIMFNILPIPPLDGAKIFLGWVNNPQVQRYVRAEREGLAALLIFGVLLPTIGAAFGLNLNIFQWYFVKTLTLLNLL